MANPVTEGSIKRPLPCKIMGGGERKGRRKEKKKKEIKVENRENE